jgi:lysophospholipase L1-like esterase
VDQNTRRSFVKKTVMAVVATGLPGIVGASYNLPLTAKTDLKILFQGDSITDGNRTRDNDWNHITGHGYPYILSSKLWFEQPERKFHFINRGISGNKVSDLSARWQTDTLDINPDILSILVGVNDANEAVRDNSKYTKDNYKQGYLELLERAKKTNPNIKFIIGEPFLLPVGQVKPNWERWFEEVGARQIIAKDLAKTFDAVFVPYQDAFNSALKRAPAEYWFWDGIHPMPGGHELMAREWLKAVKIGKLL